MNKKKKPNPAWKNATHRIWFIGLEPMPKELGGNGKTKPFDSIKDIGPPKRLKLNRKNI